MGEIAARQILFGQWQASAEALGHVGPGHLQVDAARMHALGSSDVEEGGDLAHYVPQQPRLEAAEAARVAVHRIDRPDGVTARAPGGAPQHGPVTADISVTDTTAQDQPARPVAGADPVDEAPHPCRPTAPAAP